MAFEIICDWPYGLEGLWLRYATLQNLIPSFPWIAPGWRAWGRNPRKGRDQILQRSHLATIPIMQPPQILPPPIGFRFTGHTPRKSSTTRISPRTSSKTRIMSKTIFFLARTLPEDLLKADCCWKSLNYQNVAWIFFMNCTNLPSTTSAPTCPGAATPRPTTTSPSNATPRQTARVVEAGRVPVCLVLDL